MYKKLTIIFVASVVLALASFSFAKYQPGFTVVDVSGNQVTIRKGDDKPVVVEMKKGKFKSGENVSFDAEKKRIKKEYAGGC